LSDEILDRVGDDRRSFLKKMVVGTAFAVPVVSSFSLHGMQSAFGQTPTTSVPPSTTATTATTTTTTTTTTPEEI
jgi:hypothetical protein